MGLEKNKKEQQSLTEFANRRGGRGRRNRKKTISDIGGMFGSKSQAELAKITMAAMSNKKTEHVNSIPEVIDTTVTAGVETNPRGATVPGEFRKVNDPFGVH